MAKTDLTNQRQVFVEEYVCSGDYLEAAKKAGYKDTQLRLAEKQEKTKNKNKHSFFKKRQLNQFQKTTLEMSNKVLDELLARSTVCRTPANPPCNQLD